MPELASFVITVMNEDAFGDSNAIGQTVLPLGPNNLLTLRDGWRSVPLYNVHGDPLEMSTLLLKTTFPRVKASDKKFQSLPVITFTFKDAKGEKVDVHMKPEAYMEKVANKYVPRVYLSEGQGAVLGANFMQDHDVFFDEDGKRVGFARSDCSYSRHLLSRADGERNISNHSRLSGVNITADAFMNDEMTEELSLMEDRLDWTLSSEWDMRIVGLVLSGIAFAVTFGICSYMQRQSKFMLTS